MAAPTTLFTAHGTRRTLHTGADLLTGKQKVRLAELFATDAHVEVNGTWGIYQRRRKNNRHIITELRNALAGNAWVPPPADS